MHWIVCACLAVPFFALANGHNTLYEGYDLAQSGYHVCPGSQTVPLTSVVSYQSPYTQLRPCGGWLPWKMCNVTLYATVYETQTVHVQKETKQCCDGYEQLGSYCALALNRSSEFTARPGVCPGRPASASGLPCHWDTDCPDWQKCCSTENQMRCVDPNTHVNVTSWLNVTVTVKAAYTLVTTNEGRLNHTRLLHSVVTGALASPSVSVYQSVSWPSGSFSTSSSLLLGSSQLLSISDISNKLQLLVETIEEVIVVDVRDVVECDLPVLRECSPLATCTNTQGSYDCTCAAGSADTYPNRPGTQCINQPPRPGPNWNIISIGPLRKPTKISPTSTSAATSTSSSPPSTTIAPSSSTSLPPSFSPPNVPLNGTDSCLSAFSPVCIIPPITNLCAHNVTGTSFSLSWDVSSLTNVTTHIELLQGTARLRTWDTGQSHWAATGLQPGVLYTVVMAPCMYGVCGSETVLKVKTEAQILEARARITNRNLTAALIDTYSEEYKSFTELVKNETVASLPAYIQHMIHSGSVIVLITGLSEGSVVVTFTLIFLPNSTPDPRVVAFALMDSLQNSTVFSIDPTSTLISDANECALGEADCSPWADCENTFGSYTCVCRSGYTDANPARPGRTCQAIADITDFTTATSTLIIPTLPTELSLSTNASTHSTTIEHSSTDTTTLSPHSTDTHRHTTSNSTASMPVTEPTNVTGISSISEPSTVSTTESTTLTPTITPSTTSTITTSSPFIPVTDAISVECGLAFVGVSVLKSFLYNRHISESSLYLGQPSCGLTGRNVTYVQIVIFWDQCGAVLQRNTTVKTTLFYTTFSGRAEVPVICTYPNNFIISTGYGPSGYGVTEDPVMGSGMFHVNIRLLNGTYPLPENYTLSSDDEVIIEVGLNSTLPQIKVVINRCWANPTSSPADTPAYLFVNNSCSVSNAYTTMLENGNSTRSLLSVNLYQLVTALDVIYLHCQIQICIETSTATCHPECLPTPRSAISTRAVNVIGMTKASCGPLLKSHMVIEDDAVNMRSIAYILLVLGLGLLALVGAVVLLLYFKRRMGNYNFQFRPQQENFTYHAFDT